MRIVVLAVVLLSIAPVKTRAQDFTTISGTPIVSDDRYSEGSAWGDINGDGYLDLFVPHLYNGNVNLLFVNNGDGTFSEVKTGPVVTSDERTSGGSFGDIDNDGDLDLLISNYFGDHNSLYLNNGDGSYSKASSGPVVNDGGHSFGSSMADYNGDGWLDLFVVNGFLTTDGEANALYRNNGDGTFHKVQTGAIVDDVQHSSSAAWCDYDNDGDLDLFVANGGTFFPGGIENVLYVNSGTGSFSRISGPAIGIANSYASNGSWGDYDNDGDFDLVVTNFLGNDNSLYLNNGDGTFTAVTDGVIVSDGGDSVSAAWGDYDNDGFLDLYVTNDFGEDNYLYRNRGDGTFDKVTSGDLVMSGGRSNGATWADYDRDGFLDLFVPNGQRPITQSNKLYRNNGTSGYNWIVIRCIGQVSNRTAIGAKVRASALIHGELVWQLRQVSGSTGFNAQNSLEAEFGLGDAAIVDSLVIEWPSGVVDVYQDVVPNHVYEAEEGVRLALWQTSTSAALPPGPAPTRVLDIYPNPASAIAHVAFFSPRTSNITLYVYDVLGKRHRAIDFGVKPIGWNQASLDTSALGPGRYFVRLVADGLAMTSHFVVTR